MISRPRPFVPKAGEAAATDVVVIVPIMPSRSSSPRSPEPPEPPRRRSFGIGPSRPGFGLNEMPLMTELAGALEARVPLRFRQRGDDLDRPVDVAVLAVDAAEVGRRWRVRRLHVGDRRAVLELGVALERLARLVALRVTARTGSAGRAACRARCSRPPAATQSPFDGEGADGRGAPVAVDRRLRDAPLEADRARLRASAGRRGRRWPARSARPSAPWWGPRVRKGRDGPRSCGAPNAELKAAR